MSVQLSELVESMKEFSRERDWEKFHDPKNLAISLTLEANEVLELFQWTQNNEIQPEKIDQLSDELADVFYWVIMLSNHYDIDLIKALELKMKKNAEKYPVSKAKGVSTKYDSL